MAREHDDKKQERRLRKESDLYGARQLSRDRAAEAGLDNQELSPYIMEVLQSLSKVVGDAEPARLLDIGGGDGVYTREVARMITKNDAAALRKLRPTVVDVATAPLRTAAGRGLNAIRASAAHLPFESDLFGCVLCIHVLEHVQDVDQAISEIHRTTRLGGYVMVVGPNRLKNVYPPFIPGTLYVQYILKDHVRSGIDAEQLDAKFGPLGFAMVTSGYYVFVAAALDLVVTTPLILACKTIIRNPVRQYEILHASYPLRERFRRLDRFFSTGNRHGSGVYALFRKTNGSTETPSDKKQSLSKQDGQPRVDSQHVLGGAGNGR